MVVEYALDVLLVYDVIFNVFMPFPLTNLFKDTVKPVFSEEQSGLICFTEFEHDKSSECVLTAEWSLSVSSLQAKTTSWIVYHLTRKSGWPASDLIYVINQLKPT